MSGRRRRHSDEDAGDRKKRRFVWLAWALVVGLLAANLVSSTAFDKGFLSPDLLWRALVWGAAAGCALLAVLGMIWIKRAGEESERSSHAWMRRGFVFSLVGVGAIVVACYDSETFTRNWFAATAVGLFAVHTVFFAMAAYREYNRAASGAGRRSRPSTPTEATPSAQSHPAETSGPGAR